ncbi:MAG: DUF1501 domain-containing protein [Deltaproteobacteria bacterium]|nr:DUF1501 domain-containing protein [Deltaproteobacteria bacterium]
MKSSRRSFLKTSLGCGCAAAVHQLLRPSVLFAQGSCAGGTGSHIVHIVLEGAHDGLYMFPFLDTARYNALSARRASVMHARTAAGNFGDSIFGVHQNLQVRPVSGALSVQDMLAAGEGRLISCVGMPNDKRSHPESMNALMAGLPVTTANGGTQWLARLMDTCNFTPYQVFRMGSLPGLTFERANGGAPPIDISTSLKNFDWDDTGDVELRRAAEVLRQIIALQPAGAPHQQALTTKMAGLYDAIPKVKELAAVSISGHYSGAYPSVNPTSFDSEGQLFADTARVLRYNHTQGLKSFVQIGLSMFDHHSDLVNLLGGRLVNINQNLSQLRADLAPDVWSKTIVIITSEFGRSISGGSGTEHGWGNVTLVLGGGLDNSSDLVLGSIPTVTELSAPDPDARNGKFTSLPAHVDYRQVFSESLAWIGVDPSTVFPGFTPGARIGLFNGISGA